MKKLILHLVALSAITLFFAGSASAIPINLQLDNVTTMGGTFPTLTTYSPGFPITGSGDIDFGTGTGSISLIDYSSTLDINIDTVLDVRLDITNWSQTITAIDGSGNITSTGGGAVACTVLGGLGGFVCPSVPTTVAGWAPADGATLFSSAILDTGAQTIVIVDNSNAAGGTVTSYYSYSVVPEPGTALLIGGGLIGLSLRRRP